MIPSSVQSKGERTADCVAGHANQDFLIAAQEQKLGPNEYNDHFENMRKLSREEGIDFILKNYELDVIIGPADIFIFSLATCSVMYIANNTSRKATRLWQFRISGCSHTFVLSLSEC